MTILRIPTPLRPYAANQSEVDLPGSTVDEIVQALVEQYPQLRPHLFGEDGRLRAFVHMFLNEEDIRDLQGLQTPVKEGDRLMIVPSVAGGLEVFDAPDPLER